MWTIIYRHPQHPEGQWRHDRPVYETRQQAADAAKVEFDGTGIRWRLMSIPADEEA